MRPRAARVMSGFYRALGLARSLAIYHGIPLRQRRLRRLYSQFVRAGDLAFDVGAHAGNRTRAFAALGCRVIALEPQPDFVRILRLLFGRSSRVEVLEIAASEIDGRIALAVSDRFPTVTTLDAPWREVRSREPGFAAVEWNRQLEIESVRLDTLIERYGVPAFVKMDVEGSELRVLRGLTRPLAALSFEYLPTALPEARACVARVEELGAYRFNVSVGESYRLESDDWMSGAEASALLETPHAQTRAGDVYARLDAGER
jgi:FkbM family methyltransferase